MTGLHLSPSEQHAWLTDRTAPALAYHGGAVAAWRRALRTKVRRLLGEVPSARTPLAPRSIWRREHPLGSIEKIVFTAEPRADVPAYVCLPAGAEPPYTFVICLQGHSTGMHLSIGVEREDETQSRAVDGDRDFGLGCMRRGLAALCIEQRAFGERREQVQRDVAEHGCHDAAMQALMLGRTLVGERVYDVDRAIDYLHLRGDARTGAIGLMGLSGGGTVTMFAAALLPRIAFAMPAGSFCTFRDSIMAMYHCMDNYIPGLLPVADMADVLGLFAPRPLVVVSGEQDPIFPIGPARRAFRQLQRIYAAHGAGERCQLVVGPGGHRFYAEAAWPVMLEQIAQLETRRASGRRRR